MSAEGVAPDPEKIDVVTKWPLTYVLSTAMLSAVGHRWLAALSTYEFDIQYRPDQHNIDADLLS